MNRVAFQILSTDIKTIAYYVYHHSQLWHMLFNVMFAVLVNVDDTAKPTAAIISKLRIHNSVIHSCKFYIKVNKMHYRQDVMFLIMRQAEVARTLNSRTSRAFVTTP